MTAIYAPLQNASAAQRGAVSTVAQDIVGPKHFLDTLTAEQIVAEWLTLSNGYTEAFTVDAAPFTASGVPLSIGGPTAAAAPFWGLRAQSMAVGGEAGTITAMGMGLHAGGGPTDMFAFSTGPLVSPGLTLGKTTASTYAWLQALDVSVGLAADAVTAALEFEAGAGYLRTPLWLDHADAVFRANSHAFRFGELASTVAELRHGIGLAVSTFGSGTEWLMSDSGPAAFTRAVAAGGGQGMVLGPFADVDLGALGDAVHLFAPAAASSVATFGRRDAGDYRAVARIHSSGAYQLNREAMGAADSGVVLGAGSFGNLMEFTTTKASGIIDPPDAATVESITINSPAVLATSIPRIEVVGTLLCSGKSLRPIIVLESVSAGSFRFSFRALPDAGYEDALAVGGTGSLRWEVAR